MLSPDRDGLIVMFRCGAIACMAITVCTCAAQDPLNRDSPQSSVAAFLAVCRAKDYRRAWRYIDVRKWPAGQRMKDGSQLARQLETILERDTQFDLAALSKDPAGANPGSNRERVDSFTLDGKTVDLDLERITLRSGSSVWVFSSTSVELIPKLARLLSDSPIEKYLPGALVNWTFLDTTAWRWIALLLLAAAVAVISRWVSWLTLRSLHPALRRFAPRINASLLDIFIGPLRLLVAVAAFRAGMEWIGPSPALRRYLDGAVALGFFAGLGWFSMRILDFGKVRLRMILGGKRESFTYSVLPLASRVLKIAVVALTAAAILSAWGYNTSTILAGLGVGGVALALAAQKTVENLFGGVAVITDRPVAIGDFCRFGDQVGTVEDIGLRSTRIRTVGRTLLTVPNGLFSSTTLENFSQRDKMLFHLTLNLKRDTTPSQVRTLLDSITHTLKRPDIEIGPIPVRFVGVGTYSLDVEIFAYVLTPDYDQFLQTQQELFLAILDEVETAGTALAVPTQAYYTLSGGAHRKPEEPALEEGPPAR